MPLREFPGGLVVKTLCFQCRGPGLISGLRELGFHMPCGQRKKEMPEKMP